MSGHSKWSTIKRQKGANDAKRGQIFTKLGNAITVAVREGGGGDPASNFKLRLAIEKARAENMPKDNIDRAIERGLGKGGAAALETVSYEGFGPNGIAIIINAITDNRNRTGPEIKTAVEKGGGTIGQPGSVSWQFDLVGVLTLPMDGKSADDLGLMAIDVGATDFEVSDGAFLVYTAPSDLHAVKEALEQLELTLQDAYLTMKPKQLSRIENKEDADKILAFLDRLDGLDDVDEVFSNVDIADNFIQ